MMRRARGLIFWPGMAQDIKQLVEACEPCKELRARNSKETLKVQSDGNCPWDKVAGDFFEIEGKIYLVVIDCYSNFIEVDPMPTITSARTIAVLKKHFARYGIPRVMIADPGSQLTSKEFRTFTKEWGIIHVESSPGHHSANGKAEAAVKVAKYLLKKAQKDGTDPNTALLEQRNTPREDTGLSPAEMMFGRRTRTMIPCFKPNQPANASAAMEKRRQRKKSVKTYHDRRAKDLSKLLPGQTVYFEHCENKR
ncbi:uncharacterized protein K02A2.6-like [Lineus longissimus]|uniref:uncharacterized protein K02A2.6-like n=1 Tax=Lineus longissimus TaxID=88925 RepID=UPI00315DD778